MNISKLDLRPKHSIDTAGHGARNEDHRLLYRGNTTCEPIPCRKLTRSITAASNVPHNYSWAAAATQFPAGQTAQSHRMPLHTAKAQLPNRGLIKLTALHEELAQPFHVFPDRKYKALQSSSAYSSASVHSSQSAKFARKPILSNHRHQSQLTTRDLTNGMDQMIQLRNSTGEWPTKHCLDQLTKDKGALQAGKPMCKVNEQHHYYQQQPQQQQVAIILQQPTYDLEKEKTKLTVDEIRQMIYQSTYINTSMLNDNNNNINNIANNDDEDNLQE